jgi:hypothetical protein
MLLELAVITGPVAAVPSLIAGGTRPIVVLHAERLGCRPLVSSRCQRLIRIRSRRGQSDAVVSLADRVAGVGFGSTLRP